MNWDAIGAVGEVLGAGAVLLTLAYLAVQVRQSRIASNAASHESIVAGFNLVNGWLATDESLNSLYVRGNEDFNSLAAEERHRYLLLLQSYTNQYDRLLKLYRIGALGRPEWEAHFDVFVGGPASNHFGYLTVSADLRAAVKAYGPSRDSQSHYSRVGLH